MLLKQEHNRPAIPNIIRLRRRRVFNVVFDWKKSGQESSGEAGGVEQAVDNVVTW